jgi:hypothetical protein
MDVRLPDGTVIKNVPDDMTKEQLVSKLKASGYDVGKLEPKQNMAPQGGVRGALTDFALAATGGMLKGGPLLSMFGESQKQATDLLDRSAYRAGGAVTDTLAGKVPPEVAAGAGYATNVGMQAIPTVVGAAAGKFMAKPTMEAGGRKLMQSALKPTLADLKTGKAARAVDTLLEKGINPTRGGVEQLRGAVDDLGDEIEALIAKSPATVNKGEVGKSLMETYNNFKTQVNPDADLAAIKKAWMEFRNHPMLIGKTEIPVTLAQKMKQGTYQQLNKKYGQLGSADVEAQKALARGLKEGISKAVPEVSGMNKSQSELINALKVSERRALMDANKNPMSLALLANSPAGFAAFMADKSALFKSLVARMLYSGAGPVPTAVGGAAGGLYGSVQGRALDEEKGVLSR